MLGPVTRLQRVSRQRGLSTVALMVGLAVGLLVAAAAVAAMAQHAAETGRLVTEARLTQALRTSTELVTRHLRRAGHWHDAAALVAAPSPSAPLPPGNPHGFEPAGASEAQFSYSSPTGREPDDAPVAPADRFGVRLSGEALQLSVGGGPWQSLTDPSLMRVTALQLVPRVQRQSLAELCPRPCPAAGSVPPGADGPSTCPPQLEVTDVLLRIEAQSTRPPAIVREAVSHVRLRNDRLVGRCAP